MQDPAVQSLREQAEFMNAVARLFETMSGPGGTVVLCLFGVLVLVWIALPFMVWAQMDHLREIRDQAAWMASYLRAKDPAMKLPAVGAERDEKSRSFYLLALLFIVITIVVGLVLIR